MEDASDKSEAATPQKLREAQGKGVVLRSQELSVLLALLLTLLAVLLLVPSAARHIAGITRQWVLSAPQLASVPAAEQLLQLAGPGLHLLAAMFVIALVFLIAAAAAYGGIHLSTFPLKPDFSRLNPAKGFKRIFSAHTLAETAKAMLKVATLMLLVYLLAQSALSSLATSHAASPAAAGMLLHTLALKAIAWLLGLQLLFAVWDLWYARRRYLQQQRMSRRELKDEFRRQEGDPEIRRKRKQLSSSLLAQLKALGNVKNADVVITNPTHVAVALAYDAHTMSAPTVVSAGRGAVAQMIRTLARRHRVPLIRQPALARTLASEQRIGEQIHREHQPGVVRIYRWLLAQPGTRTRLHP